VTPSSRWLARRALRSAALVRSTRHGASCPRPQNPKRTSRATVCAAETSSQHSSGAVADGFVMVIQNPVLLALCLSAMERVTQKGPFIADHLLRKVETQNNAPHKSVINLSRFDDLADYDRPHHCCSLTQEPCAVYVTRADGGPHAGNSPHPPSAAHSRHRKGALRANTMVTPTHTAQKTGAQRTVSRIRFQRCRPVLKSDPRIRPIAER